MKHSLWEGVNRWVLSWLLCFALELALSEALRVESRWWLALPALLFWCALLAVTERFGRFWVLPVVWVLALGLCLLMADRQMLFGTVMAVFSRAGTANGYGELVLLLLCAAAAMPISALLRWYGARLALSLAAAGLWVAAALLEWPLPRLIPASLTPLLLLTLSETIRRLRREPEPDKKLGSALLLSLLPAALLLAVLPASAEPYGYPLLHSLSERAEQLWHNVETSLHYRHRGEGEFGVSFNGLSEGAAVGESGEENSPGVIYAWPEQATDGAVYLFGNAWDRFDGRDWRSTLRSDSVASLNWRMDTAEHLYALWRLSASEEDGAVFSDYFHPNSVYLNCQNLNVRTMFTAMNTVRIDTDTARFPYADAPTGSLFDYVQRDDVWYRVYFLEPNLRTLGELLASAEGTVYDAAAYGPRWDRVTRQFPDSLLPDMGGNVNLEKIFADRAALIRRIYLDCSTVSDRAAALAAEITAQCVSDTERIAAVTAWLQSNYSYSLSPGAVPKGENFLDWLLFEGKEGYCTWYATAAVLLCRSVGVPARYVQGYRCRLSGEGYTKLDPRDAHAWCECYITGYGWVTVEATPGFHKEGTGWLTRAEELSLLEDGSEAGQTPGEGLAYSGETSPERSSQSGGRSAEAAEEPASEPAPTPFAWLPTALAVLLPGALLALWLWLRAGRKRRYERADPATRLLLDLETLLRDLRGMGYARHPEESLQQFFGRLPWRYLPAEEAEVREMTALYDRAFFSPAAPSEEELQRHRAFAARFRPKTLRQWMIWYRLQ